MYQPEDYSEVSWASKAYPEVRKLAKRPGSLAIVPVGSLEQHGHHLPTATDTILVSTVGHRAAEGLSDTVPVLVLPVIWTGHSPHHATFGGTVTMGAKKLHSVLEEIARSVFAEGFDGLLLLNGHGGNSAIVASATSVIGAEHQQKEVVGMTYFDLGEDRISQIRKSKRGGAGHAGEVETAMIAYLKPELVDMDTAHGTIWNPYYDRTRNDLSHPGPLSVYADFTRYSETGAVGSPELATRERGELFLNVFVEETEDVLRQLHQEADRA